MLSTLPQFEQNVSNGVHRLLGTFPEEVGIVSTVETAKPLLMVAEDDVILQQLLSVILERAHYRVITVSNGAEAVSTFQQHKFDLVMLDIMMPVMNGLDACAQIRSISTTIPILLLSAFSSAEVKHNARHRGASLFLTKPVRLTELKQHIQSLLQKPVCTPIVR